MDTVDKVACGTVILCGCLTGGSLFASVAAAKTTITAAAVGYGVLATMSAGASIGSVTAYFETKSQDGSVSDYFSKMVTHSTVGVAAMVQVVSKTVFQAALDGIGKGVKDLISDKISGRDPKKTVTIQA